MDSGRLRRLSALVGGACLAAACSSGSEGVAIEQAPASSAATTSTVVDFEQSDETPDVTAAPRSDGPLNEVCPASIVVQATGRLSVHLGALVALQGETPTIGDGVITGSLTRVDGTVEDVTLELRAGGPSSGFRDALDIAAVDETITIAHTSVAEVLRHSASFPTVAVATLTDLSRQAVIIDPATYPDVESVDDVGDRGIEVRHFTESPAFAFVESTGILGSDQLVDGFGGQPAGFVTAGGAIGQQGDVLLDPTVFATLPQWGRPVVALALSDVGWADHDDVLAVRSDELDELSECLERFVPLVQEAIIAYAADPGPANETLASARATFDPLSRVTVELLDAAETNGARLGVVGNGADATVGDVDVDRLDAFLGDLADVLGVDAVSVEAIATERFVDPSIGF